MTRDEILAMPPGREMDALVAEKVMGWGKPETDVFCRECLDPTVQHWERPGGYRCGDRYAFSLDPAAVWMVVEELVEMGRYPTIHIGPTEDDDEPVCFVTLVNPLEECPPALDMPHAICRASLLAVMERGE